MQTLEDYLKYMLKSWKLVLLIVAGCALLFTGAVKLFYERVVTENSILEQYYEAQVELYEDIVNNPESEQKDQAFFSDPAANDVLLRHFREELALSPIGYMETVTLKSAVIFGALFGGVLAVSVTYAGFVKNKGKEE